MNNSIADKLEQIARNEQLIYNAGVIKSKSEISTALDSIIAIQNSFLSFTFTVDYPAINGYGIELHANVGMTWEAWVDSEYNIPYNEEVGKLLYNDGGECLMGTWGDETVYNSKGERQTLSDIIVAGEHYCIG